MNNILLVALLNIITFVIALGYGRKTGYIEGYQNGMKEEQLVMGLSIARAFKEDKEEALRKVGSAYKQLNLEAEQEYNDRKSNG